MAPGVSRHVQAGMVCRRRCDVRTAQFGPLPPGFCRPCGARYSGSRCDRAAKNHGCHSVHLRQGATDALRSAHGTLESIHRGSFEALWRSRGVDSRGDAGRKRRPNDAWRKPAHAVQRRRHGPHAAHASDLCRDAPAISARPRCLRSARQYPGRCGLSALAAREIWISHDVRSLQ